MGALTDLEVDRVDAVDRPATKRKFLIVKAEGDGDGVAEAKRLLSAATKALGSLRKAELVDTLDDAQLAALNELREALGDEGGETFAKSAAKPAETPKPDEGKPAETAKSEAPVIDAEALGTAIAKAIVAPMAEAVVSAIRKAAEEDDEDVDDAPAPPPASSQPAEPIHKSRSAVRKLGEGVFESSIFGPTQRLGRN